MGGTITNTLAAPVKTFPHRTAAWLLRLLMAALLFFGSEILLWIDPAARTSSDWPLLIGGYIVLGTVMLDLAARYHVRSFTDVMTLATVYALLNGLLLNPETIQGEFSQQFLTRIIGAHSLFGLEMFGLFLALTTGNNRRNRRLLMGYSIWLGFYWGVWMRWSPVYSDWLAEDVPLATMFAFAGGIIVLMLALFALTKSRSREIQQQDLILPPLTAGISITALIALLVFQLAEGTISSGFLTTTLALLVLCMLVLWYQRSEKGETLLEDALPPSPLGWSWIGLSITLFAIFTIIAYSLPLIDFTTHNQLSLMQFGFAGLGTIWLPIIAISVSINAFDRETRRLD